MRHITPGKLDRLEAMLEELRAVSGLTEKKRGVFYRKSKAFLHFHEDPEGLFADLRLEGPDFDRYEVTSRAQQKALVGRILEAVGETGTSTARGLGKRRERSKG